MPPVPLHTSAIAVHSILPAATFSGAVLSELQPEDFLLVHSCTRKGDCDRLQEVDADGSLVLDIRYNQRLTYTLTASILAFDGLASYHPGRTLDDRLLAFANGRPAFQFRPGGKLIYMDPRQTLDAGDLPALEFTVENVFIDLDTDTYPSTYTILYTDLPTQPSSAAVAGLDSLLRDIFYDAGLITGTLSGTLYASATPLSGAQPSEPWSTLSEPVSPDTTLDACPAILWSGAAASRTVDLITFDRSGTEVCSVTLAAPLTVPAWSTLRAAAADLSLQLTWPYDGVDPGSASLPARFALRYLLGDPATGLPATGTDLTVKVWDGDPLAAGTLLDSFTVPRTSGGAWTVSGPRLSVGHLWGTNLAPGGDWAIAFVTVEIPGINTYWIRQAVSLTILSGNPVHLPPGTIGLTLS